jgi:4-hydroxybenzoate polyprenyltransferase/phosphoserine phosphatase
MTELKKEIPMAEPVLAVDLDGTLLRTDSLWESLLTMLRDRPLSLGTAAIRLLQGRAAFKGYVADCALPDLTTLPLNEPLLAWLTKEHQSGRRLVLATAADRRIAAAVATRIGLFDQVLATDEGQNLKGEAKAAELVAHFGKGGFDYAGDSRADLPVWREARHAIVVGGPDLERAARQVAKVERVFAPEQDRFPVLLRALRLHQWAKNLLIFLPLLAAHRLDGAGILAAILAFLAFGLTASTVYLFNDLLDLPADRRHPRKCRRPFAAGTLPLDWGLIVAPLLLMTAAILSLLTLPPAFSLVLMCYVVVTSAYSFSLKRLPIVDVLLLAVLYTVRVIAGAAAVAILPSFWLLAFCMFIFLSLALSKRYTELLGLQQRGELTAAGRGWHVDDLPLVQTLGTSAGLNGVLVLALYIDSEPARQLYASPLALWLVCPLLLYWISRLWFKTHRDEMHDDPVVFALRDRVSLLTGALAAGIVLLATLGIPG